MTIKNAQLVKIKIPEPGEDNKPAKAVVKWGPSLRIDFDPKFDDTTGKITIAHGSVKVFGSGNEQYVFTLAIAPNVEVKDTKNNVVAKGACCGT